MLRALFAAAAAAAVAASAPPPRDATSGDRWCSVTLDRKLSSGSCVFGSGFSCFASNSSMWVRGGCRGVFTCNNVPNVTCDPCDGTPNATGCGATVAHVCPCNSLVCESTTTSTIGLGNAVGSGRTPTNSSTAAAVAKITPPNTSLATIPVAYFGGTTRPRGARNYAMLSKMRLVMVEKWEGRCWHDCLANATAAPPLPCDAGCAVERDMLAMLREVKALNPRVSTVFYWNTLLAFPFYAAVGRFAADGALLMDANTKQPVALRNDNGMPGIGVYNFGVARGRALWEGLVRDVVGTGLGRTVALYRRSSTLFRNR